MIKILRISDNIKEAFSMVGFIIVINSTRTCFNSFHVSNVILKLDARTMPRVFNLSDLQRDINVGMHIGGIYNGVQYRRSDAQASFLRMMAYIDRFVSTTQIANGRMLLAQQHWSDVPNIYIRIVNRSFIV